MGFSEPGKCGQKSYDPTTLWPTRRLRQVAGATNKGIPQALVRFEEPARALREAAAEHGATLLVVGHRRLGALDRVVVGSTSGALVREAPCPVLVVAEGSGDSWEEARPLIVCGVDGSDDADHAARTAAALANRCDYDLVLASVSEASTRS